MRNFSLLLASLSICATACSTSDDVAPTYEPLVCDSAAADHVVFAVQESAALFGPYADKYYGRRFLIIDGSCRYFTNYGQFGEVRSGVLTSEELMAINGELLTGAWESIDGEHRYDIMGFDAPTVSLWRDGLGASCYWYCGEGASASLVAMLRIAFEWQTRLAERAMPVEGPVRLAVYRNSPGPYEGETEWTGATSISAALGDASYAVVDVVDPADAVALRAQRTSLDGNSLARVQLREGDISYLAVVLDAMPHADAEGRFSPPFPIMSYGPF